MTLPGQIKAAFTFRFEEQLQLLFTSPEFKHQSAGTGLNDLVEPASGELVIEFNRHCLKENSIHNDQIMASPTCLQVFPISYSFSANMRFLR